MKQFLGKIIIFLIEFIEKIQYLNLKKDENNPLNKFVDIFHTNNISVRGEKEWIPVSEINVTVPMIHYYLKLDNGMELECADNHIVIDIKNCQRVVKELKKGDFIQTKKGLAKVLTIKKTNYKTSMFDLSLDYGFLYYTNGILSHNTVSAAIYILWFCLFNTDKGVMIIANKGQTVNEIVDKIKSIYRYVPFFLKRGVVNWNVKSITFDNGCRIKTENRTEEPAIGFTIDLLYFDEFAKVPDNILRTFYGTAVPIISSLENSKIIITSTPYGYNLFHELYMGALKAKDDPAYNGYEAMRVYWYQVKGRRDTFIIPKRDKIEKYGILLSDIVENLEKNHQLKTYLKIKNNQKICCVEFDLDNEKTHINEIRKIRINGVPLLELAIISNWQEQQTALIGGESMFRQEFGLEFITGDKLLFDDVEIQRLDACSEQFDFIPIPIMDKKMTLPYENLKWIKNRPELFNLADAKKYYIFGGIDASEGLGLDYTAFNIFRLKLKDKDFIIKNRHKFSNLYDFFQLEQIGYFRSNIYSPKEFALLFYLIMFEIFDPEKCKVALELNGPGSDILAHLYHVFEGNNNYSSSIFARYKHAIDSKIVKPGLKIGTNKKSVIKCYQDAVKKQNVIIHDPITIFETKTFTRHDTPSGDYTYKAESGNDDSIMSVINMSTMFENVDFKNLVDNYIAVELSDADRKFLEDRIVENKDSLVDYYAALISDRKRYQKPVLNKGFGQYYNKSNKGLPPYYNPNNTGNFDIFKRNKL